MTKYSMKEQDFKVSKDMYNDYSCMEPENTDSEIIMWLLC